jgi:hydrogenase nickel incorporation protein HypA/HybF
MHEISLVRNILRTLQDEFPGRLPEMTRVQVKAGLLSNVQPVLMQNAFEAVAEDDPSCAHIRLEVVVLPILIRCDACGRTCEVEQYRFVCACGKPSRDVVQGEELYISEVEFRDDQKMDNQ